MFEPPVVISLWGHQILLHSILEAAGIFLGARYYWYLRRKQNEKMEMIASLAVLVGATFGAYFGSHILGALENIPEWIATTDKLEYLLFNKTLVGGLLGGLIGVEGMKKLIGEKRSTGDLFVFPLLLAIIIGRIGCFSAGILEQTYGLPTTLPWGMDLGDHIPRHPVALYEVFYLLLIWPVLGYIQRRYSLRPGALFKLFMIFYLSFRFFLDFIKPGWRFAGGMGSIQLACLLGLMYYGKYILDVKKLLLKRNGISDKKSSSI